MRLRMLRNNFMVHKRSRWIMTKGEEKKKKNIMTMLLRRMIKMFMPKMQKKNMNLMCKG